MSKVCTQDRTVKLPQNACFLFWDNLYPHFLDTLCMCVKPRPRLTCSWERAPLCICRSSLLPLIHRVSRGSCPHGNLYRILTPWDAGSSSSSSATSVLLKSDGDSANWKDLNLLGWTQKLQLPVGCSQRQHDWFLLRCEDLTWNLIYHSFWKICGHSLSSTTWVSVLSSDPATGRRYEESRTTLKMLQWPQQGCQSKGNITLQRHHVLHAIHHFWPIFKSTLCGFLTLVGWLQHHWRYKMKINKPLLQL